MLPLVSIIVPVYNVEKYLRECLNSLVTQTYPNLEILLIDDGSKDSSGKICDEYARAHKNFYAYHKKNTGLGLTRNYGLNLIKGDYVTFVDSDDYLDKNAISHLIAGLNDGKNDTVIGGFTKITDSGKRLYVEKYPSKTIKKDAIYNKLFVKMLGSAPERHDSIRPSVWNTLYSVDIIKKNNLKFVSERELISEDIVWDSAYYRYCKSVQIISIATYYYRFNPNSLTNTYRADRFHQSTYFFEYMLNRLSSFSIYNEAKERLSKNLFINVRASISQEKYNSFKKRYSHIKSMCNDVVLAKAIAEYPINRLGKSQMFFILMIKYKMTGMLTILSKLGVI